MWAWPIVNITTARMEGAQDYRSSWRDRTNNIMTTDDWELTNSYPKNSPDDDVVNVDEYLKRRHILRIIRLTSSRDTLVDTDTLFDPELDESEFLMTLSSFLAQPRHGYLDCTKRIIGFSSKMDDPAIRIRTDMPDLIDFAIERYDWSKTAYAGYADSNLCHNILDDGKAVTWTLHFINQTPFNWYSKKQAAAETATYGAKGL